METDLGVVWMRRSLRLADNPALLEATKNHKAVLCCFVLDPQDSWANGSAIRSWLDKSLRSLTQELVSKGSQLYIAQGNAVSEILRICEETKAKKLYVPKRYDSWGLFEEKKLQSKVSGLDLQLELLQSYLLWEPLDVLTNMKTPYKVYTAFWNACLKVPPPAKPLPAPKTVHCPLTLFKASVEIDKLKLKPKINWDSVFFEEWEVGETAAHKNLSRLLKSTISSYEVNRNIPGIAGTSRLSPHLALGEISPRQIWWKVLEKRGEKNLSFSELVYLKELVWREFSQHLIFHFPQLVSEPLRENFKRFPWKKDPEAFDKWKRGMTGFPIVDAGMRELWKTGWMHNRVRMIVASFLVKNMMVSWKEGADWFQDTLVDFDLANNVLGWQWVAGCGVDASPFFRIFNPILQGEKFDKDGAYVKKWCPELAELPSKWIHQPFSAPASVLAEYGLVLGKNYPLPMLKLPESRDLALKAFKKISS